MSSLEANSRDTCGHPHKTFARPCSTCYSLLTPLTWTKQNCLVLSCPCKRCEHNCRQDETVLSCLDPVTNLQLFSLRYIEDYWKRGNWKLGWDETKVIETGSTDKTKVSSCPQLCSADVDKTRQAIISHTVLTPKKNMAFQLHAHVRCRKLIQRQNGRRVLVLWLTYFLTVYVG